MSNVKQDKYDELVTEQSLHAWFLSALEKDKAILTLSSLALAGVTGLAWSQLAGNKTCPLDIFLMKVLLTASIVCFSVSIWFCLYNFSNNLKACEDSAKSLVGEDDRENKASKEALKLDTLRDFFFSAGVFCSGILVILKIWWM